MDQEKIIQELKEIIAEIAEVEPEEIDLQTNFFDDLDMDSMSAIELVAWMEKQYGMKISEESLPSMVTLKGIMVLVTEHFSRSDG